MLQHPPRPAGQALPFQPTGAQLDAWLQEAGLKCAWIATMDPNSLLQVAAASPASRKLFGGLNAAQASAFVALLRGHCGAFRSTNPIAVHPQRTFPSGQTKYPQPKSIPAFLQAAGNDCNTWASRDAGTKLNMVVQFAFSQGPYGPQNQALYQQYVHQVDAYCGPHLNRQIAVPQRTKPAGQAMSPTTSPMTAGILGLGLGIAAGYFFAKR